MDTENTHESAVSLTARDTEILSDDGHTSRSSSFGSQAFISTVKSRAKVLADLTVLVDRLSNRITNSMALSFATAPQSLSDPAPEPREGSFVGIRNWLEEQRVYVEQKLSPIGDYETDQRRLNLLRKLQTETARLDRMKDRAWSNLVVERIIRSRAGPSDKTGPVIATVAPSKLAHAISLQPFIIAALFMTTVLHTLAATSRLYVQYILATLQAIIFGAFVWCNTQSAGSSHLSPGQADLLGAIPDDIRTVLLSLGLEPDIKRFACCPQCFATYAPDPAKPDDPYPHVCSFRETDKPVCEAPLVRRQEHVPSHSKSGRVRVTYEPLLVYPYRTVQSWLADLLARPGFIQMMKAAWKGSTSSHWRDIFDAPGLRQFLGPDGKTPFSSQPDQALHLVFSLFVDWFNPFGNKKAGKSQSVGAIYLVCMNLPPHLRYRPENICLVSMIPGPKEPELAQLNHLIRPLVDELLVLWHRGILFAGASSLQAPIFVRAAVVPLVCDIPALRKTAGFAGHMAMNFCSFCELPKSRINDLDRSKWTRHSWQEHLRYAAQWRNLTTEKERDAHFKQHGIRWSELLRLDYWDPTQFAVVDAMHNLFLGELRHHCREVWGIDVKDRSSDSPNVEAHTPEQQRRELLRVQHNLRKGSKTGLEKIRKGYIAAVAEVNAVAPAGGIFTKSAYVNALLSWIRAVRGPIMLPPVLEEATTDFHVASGPHDISKFRVIDQPTVDQVRKDIVATYLPSWMERPPKNFGSPSHGKLKADQWRTVCTVSLVITLCRLWGSSGASQKQSLLLDNFLSLVCAVDLATRRSMNIARVEKFDGYMMKYLKTLRSLFSHQLVPNHHLSLHLRECLLLFGPVHAWWAFPFERYNGLLQHLNTNNKAGQIPLTFLRYFYIGANLRWLVNTIVWPNLAPFKKMVAAYHEAITTAKPPRGMQTADFSPFDDISRDSCHDYDEKKEVELDQVVYNSLLALVSSGPIHFSSAFTHLVTTNPELSPFVNYIPNVVRDGMTFATCKTSRRNSFILFNDPANPTVDAFPRPGQIAEIFLHMRSEDGKAIVEPFFLINEYQALELANSWKDPYRRFPDIETRLFYNEHHQSSRLVRFHDILCHFAALVYKPDDIDKECIVVRSLNRD